MKRAVSNGQGLDVIGVSQCSEPTQQRYLWVEHGTTRLYFLTQHCFVVLSDRHSTLAEFWFLPKIIFKTIQLFNIIYIKLLNALAYTIWYKIISYQFLSSENCLGMFQGRWYYFLFVWQERFFGTNSLLLGSVLFF